LSNLRVTWLSKGLIWAQYMGTLGPDDHTKVGERFFYRPNFRLVSAPGNFHTILSRWVKF
jgi:hypothetical protein